MTLPGFFASVVFSQELFHLALAGKTDAEGAGHPSCSRQSPIELFSSPGERYSRADSASDTVKDSAGLALISSCYSGEVLVCSDTHRTKRRVDQVKSI